MDRRSAVAGAPLHKNTLQVGRPRPIDERWVDETNSSQQPEAASGPTPPLVTGHPEHLRSRTVASTTARYCRTSARGTSNRCLQFLSACLSACPRVDVAYLEPI